MTTIAQPLSIHQALKKYFGYDRFRPMQEEIIRAVLDKKDTLVLMPTGGGKSVCYQVPALVSEGTCIVVSPLIALMKDQVEALRLNGVDAAFINSSQSAKEQSLIEKQCVEGKLKLLYVAPEKLFTEGFQWLLSRIQVSLFAIDEAHCISFWGHDFRPEYAQLKVLKEQYPQVPIIALTATADKITRKDIAAQLKMQEPEIFIASFDRPNLRLNVLPGIKRTQRLLDFLEEHPLEPGIVYCLSRKITEQVAESLQRHGYKAEAYHAGLPAEKRSRVQEAFLKDDIQIVCATIAFGMGIDKSNVRWVVHYSLPKNIENYYQEIGRAGRDGAPAEALLFYTFSDVALQQSMLAELSIKQRELQEAKLDRLRQYAEAVFCRRQVLLNYFNEDYTENCGNCDNCSHPRKMLDGTVVTQKALSAVARTGESIGASTLVDILRGARTQQIVSRGYDQIKTFGTGRDIKPLEWRDYIQQMINTGAMDVAYDENHHLKLNERSKRILFEGEKVALTEPQIGYQKAQGEEAKQQAPRINKRDLLQQELMERLRKLRKELADTESLPPYMIFNDNTLQEMAQYRPLNKKAMLEISGVGFNKFDSYGESFIREISRFVNDKSGQGDFIKGGTQIQTLELLQQGYDVERIAKERGISTITVYSHLASLYEGGHDIQLHRFVTHNELEVIGKAIRAKGKDAKLKELHDHLDGEVDYGKIRLALAWAARQEQA